MAYDNDAKTERARWTSYYYQRYYNLWLNRVEIEGLTKQQRLWLLRHIWVGDCVCAFKILNPSSSFLGGLSPEAQKALDGNTLLGFAPFAPNTYSMYDYPATGLCVQYKGAPYIPQGNMVVGKDVVITYGLFSETSSLKKMANRLIDSIVDCEMNLRKNAIKVGAGTGIEIASDNPQRASELARKMMSDEAVTAVAGGDTRGITPYNDGTGFYIDKWRAEKEARENELRCLLGIDSVAMEKKERLITAEAESTKSVCDVSKACFFNPMMEFFKEIKDVLGFDVTISDPYDIKESEVKDDETKSVLESKSIAD